MGSSNSKCNSHLTTKQCQNLKRDLTKEENIVADKLNKVNIEERQVKSLSFSEHIAPLSDSSSLELKSDKSSIEESDSETAEEIDLVGEKLNNKYTVENKIGKGGFGYVYKCFDEVTNNYVAIKAIDNKEAAEVEIISFDTLREKQINSSSVITLLESFEDKHFVYLVFPLYGPDLLDAIYDFEPSFSIEEIRTIARQLIETTKLLHDNKMLHGDIKPGNILMNRYYDDESKPEHYRKPDITLCDFGCVFTEDEFDDTVTTTLPYRAPDIVLGHKMGYPSDVWSIGCTVFELATQYLPFLAYSVEELFLVINETVGPFTKCQIKQIEHVDNENRISMEEKEKENFDDLSEKITVLNDALDELKQEEKDLYDVIIKMLIIDPEKRMSLKEVLELPFFNKY